MKEMARRGIEMPETGSKIDPQEIAKRAMDTLRKGENLVGWEMALLAGVLTVFGTQYGLGQEDFFASRDVTNELNRLEKSIANITTVMDTLVERGLVENAESESRKGAHKSFKVTSRGQAEVLRIWQRICNSEKKGAA